MLNLKFVILSSLYNLFVSLIVKTSRAKQKQAEKCATKQGEVYHSANLNIAVAHVLVEEDTIILEQTRVEALARVNIDYNKKIAGLQVNIDEAEEHAAKQHSKWLKYQAGCGSSS